jgi:hypothetical protein
VRERLVFREKEKSFSSYELDIIENYLIMNSEQIENSTDHSLLHLDTIKKWGAETGNTIIKAKTATKEVEAEKIESDEYQTYREIFENHPTFKGTPFPIQTMEP